MIQPESKLKVIDNSGAKIIQCISVLGASKKRYAQIGDVIVASVKEAEPRKEVKKGEVIRAVVVRQKRPYRRDNGTYIRFDENAAVILEGKSKNPKGGRVKGPIPRELKQKGFGQVVASAKEIV